MTTAHRAPAPPRKGCRRQGRHATALLGIAAAVIGFMVPGRPYARLRRARAGWTMVRRP